MNQALQKSPQNRAALFASGAVLVAVLGGLWFLRRGASTPAESASEAQPAPVAVQEARAKLGPVEQIVEAQGTLVPGAGGSVRVAVTAAGRLKTVLVHEGDKVQAGQLLALVDDTAQRSAQASAQAALQGALADSRSAEAAVKATQNDQLNAVRQASIALQSAITTRNADVMNARNAFLQTQSDLKKARLGAGNFDLENAVQNATLALKAAQSEGGANVLTARNALSQAQTDLAKTQNGPRPPEISAAQAAVAQAQATRDRAAQELERVQFLESKGIRAKRDVEDAQTALKVAEGGLQSANDALTLLQNGARPEDLKTAQLAVDNAHHNLDATQNAASARIKEAQSNLRLAQGNRAQGSQTRPQDVRSAILKVQGAREALLQAQKNGDNAVSAARATLQAAQSGVQNVEARRADAESKQAAVQGRIADAQGAQVQTAYAQLRAPIGGIVTKRVGNAGEVADPATPIVEITNPSTLVLAANLPPEAGARVQMGQRVRIQSEAAPGQIFGGRVLSVGSIDPASNLQSMKIAVVAASNALQNGAFATASIIVASRPLALLVPAGALLTRDGKTVLFVDAKGVAKQRTVVPGEKMGANIEIKRGLQPNEKVLTQGQYELEDGAEVQVAS